MLTKVARFFSRAVIKKIGVLVEGRNLGSYRNRLNLRVSDTGRHYG